MATDLRLCLCVRVPPRLAPRHAPGGLLCVFACYARTISCNGPTWMDYEGPDRTWISAHRTCTQSGGSLCTHEQAINGTASIEGNPGEQGDEMLGLESYDKWVPLVNGHNFWATTSPAPHPFGTLWYQPNAPMNAPGNHTKPPKFCCDTSRCGRPTDMGSRPSMTNQARSECATAGMTLCQSSQLCPCGAPLGRQPRDEATSADWCGTQGWVPIRNDIDQWMVYNDQADPHVTPVCSTHLDLFWPDPHPYAGHPEVGPRPDSPTGPSSHLFCCGPPCKGENGFDRLWSECVDGSAPLAITWIALAVLTVMLPCLYVCRTIKLELQGSNDEAGGGALCTLPRRHRHLARPDGARVRRPRPARWIQAPVFGRGARHLWPRYLVDRLRLPGCRVPLIRRMACHVQR